jgi:hypothetical protein
MPLHMFQFLENHHQGGHIIAVFQITSTFTPLGVKVVNCIASADRRTHGRNLKKCNYVTPPDDGFLELETYVGAF